MLEQEPENLKIVLQFSNGPTPRLRIVGEHLVVFLALNAQRSARILALVPVLNEFDRLLKAYGDAQSDDDDSNVDEEVSPAADGAVYRMHVEHWQWALLCGHWNFGYFRLGAWRFSRCTDSIRGCAWRRHGRECFSHWSNFYGLKRRTSFRGPSAHVPAPYRLAKI
jgi:hypothetical protein